MKIIFIAIASLYVKAFSKIKLHPTYATRLYNREFHNKKYYNIEPERDLIKITSSEASILSKEWLTKLKLEYPYGHRISKDGKQILKLNTPDYLFDSINKIERYINSHRSDNDIYMKWCPTSKNSDIEPLFIIATEIEPENGLFKVNLLVQSPNWNPNHINTIEIKKALESINLNANCTSIDYSGLKNNDPRYYFSWFMSVSEKII
jgi:hypothetical protein